MMTNTTPQGELREAANRLLTAAMDYYEAYRRAGCQGAVVWLKDTAGRMVILTRGEYRDTLMRNIDRLHANAEAEEVSLIDYDGDGGVSEPAVGPVFTDVDELFKDMGVEVPDGVSVPSEHTK